VIGDSPIVHYAILRDGSRWEKAKLAGLEIGNSTALELSRVPAPAQDIVLPGPYAVNPSGIAVGRCGDVFLADTAMHRVIWRDGICGSRINLPNRRGVGNAPGQFDKPRGLLLGTLGLYVADSGNSRVQIFRLPTLEPRAEWSGELQEPTGLAGDERGRIYVLDRELKRILRFNAWGVTDEPFNSALGSSLGVASPKHLAVDDERRLYVAEDLTSKLRCFNEDGTLHDVPPSRRGSLFHPGALAAKGARLFVADAKGGRIWL
jgi:sugar lactone lactonase YvrE